MLLRASKRAKKLDRRVTLQRMNAEALAFGDHAFDTVVSTLALCTFPHPLAALAEMKRVCTPAGRVLLLEHGKSSIPFLARLQRRSTRKWLQCNGCHLDRELPTLLRAAGFRILQDDRSLFGILHTMQVSP